MIHYLNAKAHKQIRQIDKHYLNKVTSKVQRN